ncbi:MAG: hypothetical protein FWC19_08630 [Treponema sp.]|nr:hypothetical protein [Treponema sp.]MCL2272846.1 hypothetical protein [Treponema sp.]
MFKKQVFAALVLLVIFSSIPAWANPLAEAAYDARIAENEILPDNSGISQKFRLFGIMVFHQ